jgi:hypothetical protein
MDRINATGAIAAELQYRTGNVQASGRLEACKTRSTVYFADAVAVVVEQQIHTGNL